MAESMTLRQAAPVRWAKVVDQTRCIGCHACSTACKSENEVPLGVTRTFVKYVEVGEFPAVRRAFQVTRCNQCESAPCTYICPTGAMHARKDGIVDFDHLIADAKSGVSGAGRKAEVQLLLAEASDNFKAYGVAGHRHHPEIVQGLARAAGRAVNLIFVPHLVPMIRGIHATLYARLTAGSDLQALYEKRYAGEAFVDVMPAGSHPDTRSVRGANTCRIAVHQPRGGDIAVVLSVIDNLVKGASGQAVQNMNIMFGLPETTGLGQLALLP